MTPHGENESGGGVAEPERPPGESDSQRPGPGGCGPGQAPPCGGQFPPGGGPFPMGCPGQFPPGYPGYPMGPGFGGPDTYGGYGQFPGYPGYPGYGMYPGMYPGMFGGYGMFPPPPGGYYPQGPGGGCFPGGPGGPPCAGDAADGRGMGRPSAPRPGVNTANMMPGDWLCPRCGDHVFARNRACRRCATPRPDGAGDMGGSSSFADRGLPPPPSGGSNQREMPGDWYCPKCRDLQFARNRQCRMCGCPKPEGGAGGFEQTLQDQRAGGGGPRSRCRSRSRRRRSRS